MSKRIITLDYFFHGHMRPPVVGSAESGIWRKLLVNTALVQAKAGLMELELQNNNEAQSACLYMGDELSFFIDKLVTIDVWASLTASFAAANSLFFGMASAQNATLESMTAFAGFKCVGNNNVVVSTDDNVVDLTDKATGMTLGTTIKRFNIDFGSGINSVVGGLSTGGKSNVIFSMEDDRGNLRRVCETQRFDMSNYSAGFQFLAQCQKTAGTTTGKLSIKQVRISYRED